MPIANIQDAREVERGLRAIFDATDTDDRARAIRSLFVETLDFDQMDRLVSLEAAKDRNLPSDARLLARRSGFSVLYIPMDDAENNRVNTITASAAAKVIGDTIADEPLLLFTNRDCDQLHVIYPDLSGSRPRLQRMVAHRGHPGRTVVQQIANLWHDYGELGTTMGEAVSNAFNVEPVTSAFFRDYKDAYDDAVSLIAAKVGQGDAEQFTQTLFNRLLFVHFVSRKGWLRLHGDADYLNALWRDYQADAKAKNFYTSRLSTLFFAGLNNPQSQNLSNGVQPLIGEVPFLNGGLFEETDIDKRAANAVPNDVIKVLLGDGERSGLFNRYNFTVSESTPLDTEVAVDPEMLGKLFEETVNERHSNGAYYTPRPVVAFMCREAIKGYLAGQGIANLDNAKIVDLVDQRNPDAITPMQAPEIYKAIKNIKAVDPACGSGAFLLGMLQELIVLNETLFRAGHTSESLYQQKLDLISNNIHGADKDGLAVSTAMLRLWLSLAVDYEGDGAPPPLPNLDLKLVVGDTIAGPDPQQYDLTLASIVNSGLRQDIAAYTNAQGQRKATLKKRVDDTKQQLRDRIRGHAPADTVEWRIDFADVVLNGGFDVVIANPPYVVTSDKQLRELYKEGVYGRANTYGMFIQRGLQLAGEGGQLSYINPRTLLTDRYFTNLRKVIKRKSELAGVVLIADRHNTFERVLQECIILRLVKRSSPRGAYLVNTRAIATTDDLSDPQTAVSVDSNRVLLPDAYDGAFFVGGSEFEYQVFERMNDAGVKLSSFGLKAETGKIQFDKYKDYAQTDNANDACRLIWAENIQRYTRRPSRNRIGKEWLSKGIITAVPPNMTGSGIVTQRTSANEQPRRIIATLITPRTEGSDNVYSENGTNFISLTSNRKAEKFLIATLNSSLVEFAFRHLNSNVHVSAGEINALPFPPIPGETKLKEIESLVSALMAWGGVDCGPDTAKRVIEAERHLDILIGALYGFTASEVEQIQIQGYLPSYETVYGLTNEEMAASARAGERAEDKPRFEVVPNRGGFAPGVDPSNLKEIIQDLEDEEFLEKLAP